MKLALTFFYISMEWKDKGTSVWVGLFAQNTLMKRILRKKTSSWEFLHRKIKIFSLMLVWLWFKTFLLSELPLTFIVLLMVLNTSHFEFAVSIDFIILALNFFNQNGWEPDNNLVSIRTKVFQVSFPWRCEQCASHSDLTWWCVHVGFHSKSISKYSYTSLIKCHYYLISSLFQYFSVPFSIWIMI